MVKTVDGKFFLLVSQKKWDMGMSIIKIIQYELRLKGCLDHKQLEHDRGFLVYLSRTYKNICPYLKGVHHTFVGES